MPPSNQTFELAGLEPGHLVIAFNDAMVEPSLSREGFNQACRDIQPLWQALGARLSSQHFLALAGMFLEYMRVLESTSREREDLSNAQNQALRNFNGSIMCNLQQTAAGWGLHWNSDDAESSSTGRDDVVSSLR